MNNLTLFILGLVLINVPSCLSKQCIGELFGYPCCKDKHTEIFFRDEDGDWGIEGWDICYVEPCFSISLGNRCCEYCNVVYTDDKGNHWGIENNEWCGIKDRKCEIPDEIDEITSCFSFALGYHCCEQCNVVYTDDAGQWGIENNDWCGIRKRCFIPDPFEDESEFDFTFLKMENNKNNMLYSPLSIKYALKMLQEGASNNTLTEIDKVLENTSVNKYETIDKILSLANGLFIKDIYYDDIKEEYLNTLKEKYDAEVKKDEFENAENVNQWIEDKTLGIIKNVVSDKIVKNPDTAMLLINALAIDMKWADKFDYRSTSGKIFYLDNGEEMEATTMRKKYWNKNLSYYEDNSVTAITLDLMNYENTQFEFMAIMPNENLSAYVKNVTKKQINKIYRKLIPSEDEEDGVVLEIPKFKFSYDLPLKDDLIDLGINDAFVKDNANFKKIADLEDPSKNLYVSEALHKAEIEFSEDGIRAAAAAVAVMGGVAAPRPPQPVYIYINKPFMFIIRDKNTRDIWFTGTVYEPNAWADDEKNYD